jgi:hypothetical protein
MSDDRTTDDSPTGDGRASDDQVSQELDFVRASALGGAWGLLTGFSVANIAGFVLVDLGIQRAAQRAAAEEVARRDAET